MNINKLKLFGGALLLFISLPAASEAYFTTDQTATLLTPDTALFTVTYEFGFSSRDFYMPIVAERGSSENSEDFKLMYEALDKHDAITETGTMSGMVLTNDADVEIKDGKYFVPAGKSAKFTLFTLIKASPEVVDSNSKASLLVSHLPFNMIVDDTEISAQLNPSELQYYRTPEVRF